MTAPANARDSAGLYLEFPVDGIIIGKRVTFGAIVGGLVSVGCFVWGVYYPQNPIPAEVAVGLTTAITGVGQLLIVNKFGVTSA